MLIGLCCLAPMMMTCWSVIECWQLVVGCRVVVRYVWCMCGVCVLGGSVEVTLAVVEMVI